MICDRCHQESEEYGGYAVKEAKNFCPKCWQLWIEVVTRHYHEIQKFLKNGQGGEDEQ